MKYILGTLLAIFCATASYDAFAGPNITQDIDPSWRQLRINNFTRR